jgi:acetolactate synthase I/II/III large subunit
MSDPIPTLAEALAEALAARGVHRIFGVPGGGSSLHLIDAVEDRGIDFVLTQTESAGAIMAAVTAELSGAPGVVITGVGPGASSAVNGIAYASLERAPVVLITDVFEPDPGFCSIHQSFDQGALYAPLTKASRRLVAEDGRAAIDDLLDTATALPRGPVHIDLSTAQAGKPIGATAVSPANTTPAAPHKAQVAAARALLATAAQPVILAGLMAREEPAPAALMALADQLACPVFTSYKAKGVFPDGDPRAMGPVTNAAAESECIGRADLIVFFGFDPVEFIQGPWRYEAPVLDLSPIDGLSHPVDPAASLIGPLDQSVECLYGVKRRSDWTEGEIACLRTGYLDRLSQRGPGRTAQDAVEAIQRAAPDAARVAIDSGAHMFSAITFWQAQRSFDVLKSNGLSTMAYALPAAIGATLHDPARPVVAISGDGGAMMCLSELATAARHGCQITLVILNDAALSLIDIKQQRAGRPCRGVRYPAVDFARAARGLGCHAWQVGMEDRLDPALTEAFAVAGPTLIEVAVDPSSYGAQFAALREWEFRTKESSPR